MLYLKEVKGKEIGFFCFNALKEVKAKMRKANEIKKIYVIRRN
jgi:hypothetical protein